HLGQMLALAYHDHLWLLVLAPPSHSCHGFGPCRPGGTLQLSTRCSPALLLSRSLAVRVGSVWIWFACPSARDPDDICATSIITINRTADAPSAKTTSAPLSSSSLVTAADFNPLEFERTMRTALGATVHAKNCPMRVRGA